MRLTSASSRLRCAIRSPMPRLAMERPRALDVGELALEVRDPLADQTAIDFELALSGSAEEAETATLALEVGPRTN